MYSENDWRLYTGGELMHGQWEWPNGNNSKAYNAWYYATHPWKWGIAAGKALYDYGKGKIEESKRKAEEEEAARDWYIDETGAYHLKPEASNGNSGKPKFMVDVEYSSNKPPTRYEANMDDVNTHGPMGGAYTFKTEADYAAEAERAARSQAQRDEALRTFTNVTEGLMDYMLPKLDVPNVKVKRRN